MKQSRWFVYGFCMLVCIITMLGCSGKEQDIQYQYPFAVWADDKLTFTDPDLGIVVDFPKDWQVILTDDGEFRHFYSPCSLLVPDVLPPCTKIQISKAPFLVNDAEELLALHKADLETPYLIVQEDRVVETNGLLVLWTKSVARGLDEENPNIHLQILVDTQVVYLNVYGNLEPMEAILNSVRRIDP